jgi:hypothetical protein
MDERITTWNQKCQRLLPYPYPHDFLLKVRYCCNQKIVHLLRHLAPHISASATTFDDIIDRLIDAYYDLRLSSPDMLSIHDIPLNLPSLSAQHMQCLARVQLRALPTHGGLDLPAMSDIAIPAFYAAHTRHLRQRLQKGVPVPFLCLKLPPAPVLVFSLNLSTRPNMRLQSEVQLLS